MSTALVPTNGPAALALAHELGARMDATGLVVDDDRLTYDDWVNIGRAISFVGNAWQWWVGDWLNIGEVLYGEQAAAAVDDLQTRYDAVRSVTGAATGTLNNIRSICSRVPKKNRKQELGFWVHAPLTKLEGDEQKEWLDKAVKEKWSRSDLRIALAGGDPSAPRGRGDGDVITMGYHERLEQALKNVLATSQATGNGWHEVPDDAIEQLRALFEEND